MAAVARCAEIASAALTIAILVANDAAPRSAKSMGWASSGIIAASTLKAAGPIGWLACLGTGSLPMGAAGVRPNGRKDDLG